MKYIASFALLLVVLFTTHASAATTLTATKTSSTITATLNGATGSTSTFELFVQTTPFPVGEYTTTIKNIISGPAKPVSTTGTVTWTVPASSNTTYYLRVVERPSITGASVVKSPFYTAQTVTVKTSLTEITPGTLDFSYDSNSASLLIKGKIDTVKNPSLTAYDIKIQYSKTAITAETPSFGVTKGSETKEDLEKFTKEGEYYLRINSINPSTKYFIRETITYGGSKKVTDGVFNSSSGYIASTNVAATQSDFEDRSYRLLAPFPGF
ncbi:hypothetical protein K2Q02_00255, partial [Patescibacteria group bacterium]|nr:hypothetical protein [Patescibacteria group bacterium]